MQIRKKIYLSIILSLIVIISLGLSGCDRLDKWTYDDLGMIKSFEILNESDESVLEDVIINRDDLQVISYVKEGITINGVEIKPIIEVPLGFNIYNDGVLHENGTSLYDFSEGPLEFKVVKDDDPSRIWEWVIDVYAPVNIYNVTASSTLNNSYLIENAFDDDPATFWHSQTIGGSFGPSEMDESIIIEFDGIYELSQLQYLPRQDTSWGRLTEYEIYIKETVDGDFTKVLDGSISYEDAELQIIDLTAVNNAAAIMFKGIQGANGMSAAELKISGRLIEEIETYTLTINTTGNGSVIKDPDQIEYSAGTEVSLTAEADSNWEFVEWQGDTTGTSDTITVTMDADKTVTAEFAETPYETIAVDLNNVTVSSTLNDNEALYGKQNVFDEDASTIWHVDGGLGGGWNTEVDISDEDMWIAVEFDGIYDLSELRFRPRDNNFSYLNEYEVYVKESIGGDFVLVGQGQTEAYTSPPVIETFDLSSVQQAVAVKLKGTVAQNGAMAVAEMEIVGR